MVLWPRKKYQWKRNDCWRGQGDSGGCWWDEGVDGRGLYSHLSPTWVSDRQIILTAATAPTCSLRLASMQPHIKPTSSKTQPTFMCSFVLIDGCRVPLRNEIERHYMFCIICPAFILHCDLNQRTRIANLRINISLQMAQYCKRRRFVRFR